MVCRCLFVVQQRAEGRFGLLYPGCIPVPGTTHANGGFGGLVPLFRGTRARFGALAAVVPRNGRTVHSESLLFRHPVRGATPPAWYNNADRAVSLSCTTKQRKTTPHIEIPCTDILCAGNLRVCPCVPILCVLDPAPYTRRIGRVCKASDNSIALRTAIESWRDVKTALHLHLGDY